MHSQSGLFPASLPLSIPYYDNHTITYDNLSLKNMCNTSSCPPGYLCVSFMFDRDTLTNFDSIFTSFL